MEQTPKTERLKPETVAAFEAYIVQAEREMESTLDGSSPFLWSDGMPKIAQRVREGETVAQSRADPGPVHLPEGLIHDWIGATFVPATTLAAGLALVQDYDHHKTIYKPEVIESKLVSREDDFFKIYLRLLKKKILTVVLDTDHDVQYRRVDETRAFCRSHSTRIAEVEHPGTKQEQVLPPDSGHGFLWRLYSYWRFQEREGGLDLECRAISMSRDVPTALKWIVEPIVQKLPKESLIHTLDATRAALRG